MFPWPEKITKKFTSLHSDPLDDCVDRLNYAYTVSFIMEQTLKCCIGYRSFLFYVIIKWLYFGVCIGQLYLINNFVGDGT
ncbi:unnamed protein product, partial [Gongylonema pulchrum]|uniref:Innexin n=1 Tax=Gongylonema pulchrum TaxID=637853 RepID=A0A183DYU6_9BILA